MYKLTGKLQNIHFSKREIECMLFFMRGQTIKRVGKILGLSPRTIEFYAKNMKNKVGCRTKNELISAAADGGFSDVYGHIYGEITS